MSKLTKEEVQKKLAGAKGWLTRATKELSAILVNTARDYLAVQDGVQTFDERLAKFDSVEEQYEEMVQEETELLDHIEKSASFRETCKKVRLDAERELQILKEKAGISVQAPGPKTNETTISVTSKSNEVARLPKLELPKFGGEILEWQNFWDQFTAVVDKSSMPEVSKFTYLQSLLWGEAKTVVSGLAITADNYGVACKLLMDRYNRKERIIFAHIQALLTVTVPTTCNVSELWKLKDTLQGHVRGLEMLGISGKQYGVLLVPMILSRLPAEIRIEWARQCTDKESDLKGLLEFLNSEIQCRERSETYKDGVTSAEEKSGSVITLQTTAAKNKSEPKKQVTCGICRKRHQTQNCWSLTNCGLTERKQKIRSANLCFRCLKSGHYASTCQVACAKCKGRHHVLICGGNRNNQDQVQGTGDSSQRSTALSTGTQGAFRASAQTQSPRFGAPLLEGTGATFNSSESVTHFTQNSLALPEASNVAFSGNPDSGTVLQTVRVYVKGERGVVQATAVLDTGSDRSYVTASLAGRAGLKSGFCQPVRYQAFGSNSISGNGMSKMYEFQLESTLGGAYDIKAAEVPVICPPMTRYGVPSDLASAFGPLKFADNYSENRMVTIDILIGLDYYWNYMRAGIIKIPGLVAQETVFGWVVSGSWTNRSDVNQVTVACSVVALCCLTDIPEDSLKKFWDLESVGICAEVNSTNNPADPVLERFRETIQYSEVENRYEVCLPWKDNPGPSDLLNNESIALHRLKGLSKQLDRNSELKVRYNDVLKDMEKSEIIVEVDTLDLESCQNPVYYLPHRPVIRESSLTTKIRPVFDASAKGHNGLSLNDCLETGPSLIPNLTGILLRFRRWQIGLTADITKAFLQIKVHPKDQDVHRFLWEVDGTVRVMKFKRVPFGNKSSPFLLNATIKHHLAGSGSGIAVTELEENLYVDDFLTGEDLEEDVCKLFRQSETIMNRAGMSFAKGASSSKMVTQTLFKEFGSKHLDVDSVRILGLTWLNVIDGFKFDGIDVPMSLQLTKRSLLSFIARLYDPLGFLNPFVMTVKILFQTVWRLELKWDEELPDNLAKIFREWLQGLIVIRQWEIPRCYFLGTRWRDLTGLEVHMFCDAAHQGGYGATVYVRVPNNSTSSFKVSFVISKARVAPVRPVTLPRLELLGALLGSRLLSFVIKALKLPNSTVYRCWTDSTIVLSWIKGNPNQWKVFVANRVREILSLTNPECWLHTSGAENPADLVTRGIAAQKLVSSKLWLNGPWWLSSMSLSQFSSESEAKGPPCREERKRAALMSVSTDKETPFPVERWGTMGKMLRVVAYVLRFIANLRARGTAKKVGKLDHSELEGAQRTLFSCIQKQYYGVELEALSSGKQLPRNSPLLKLSPFLDHEGLLRLKGRLQFSDLAYEEKHPLILPPCYVTFLLVREQHKILGHAGVGTMITVIRGNYWIVGLRRLAKRVKYECFPCKRLDTKACGEPVAPLPKLRVQQAPAFSVLGMDFAGPIYCLEAPGQKLYILLLTCAVVRAVHLELTDSLSLADFMLAFRRFVSRRGLPSVVFSDNAKTFLAASDKLMMILGSSCPKFLTINPLSPWWGGWWERLVRSVKGSLRKSVGKGLLKRKELETVLVEAEACINSRPLTVVGDGIDSLTPLTPSHFLIGRCNSVQPKVDLNNEEVVTSLDLQNREKQRLQLLEQFWAVWHRDYLCNLPPTLNRFRKQGDLEVGSVVLVKEDHVPRLSWPLGIVLEKFPGRDGICRSVKVKTQKGEYVRSIQRLYDLEMHPKDPLVTDGLSSVSEGAAGMPQEHGGSGDNVQNVKLQDKHAKDHEVEGALKYYITRSGRVSKPRDRLDL